MLIKCPECGKEVSSEATSCPFCGYPIKQTIETKGLSEYEKYTEEEIREHAKEAKSYYSNARGCVAVGLFMFLGGLIALIAGFILSSYDSDYSVPLIVVGSVIGDPGLLIMAVGGGVNNTKGNNRAKIVEDYKLRHPEFKED